MQVDQADAAGELAVGNARPAVVEAAVHRGLGAVVAAAQREGPAVLPLDLVLHVEAGLLQLGDAVEVRIGNLDRAAVDRGIDVQRRRAAAAVAELVDGGALVVHADQDLVGPVADTQVRLHLVVEVERADRLDAARRGAAQLREVDRIVRIVLVEGHEAAAADRAIVDLQVAVARVLAQRPGAVDAVFELVADHRLVDIEVVELRIAHEQSRGNAGADRRRHQRAFGGEGTGVDAGARAADL